MEKMTQEGITLFSIYEFNVTDNYVSCKEKMLFSKNLMPLLKTDEEGMTKFFFPYCVLKPTPCLPSKLCQTLPDN